MCGGASGVFLVGETPETDMGMYGAGTPRRSRRHDTAGSCSPAARYGALRCWRRVRSRFRRSDCSMTHAAIDGGRDRRHVVDGADPARSRSRSSPRRCDRSGRLRRSSVCDRTRQAPSSESSCRCRWCGSSRTDCWSACGCPACPTAFTPLWQLAQPVRMPCDRSSRRARSSRVAVAALEHRCHVSGGLAASLRTVVADDAEACHRQRNLRVVHGLGRVPGDDRMTAAQSCEVAGCVRLTPCATLPLWQLTQLPITWV